MNTRYSYTSGMGNWWVVDNADAGRIIAFGNRQTDAQKIVDALNKDRKAHNKESTATHAENEELKRQ